MPIDPPPTDWKMLQERVCRILADCKMKATVEEDVVLTRGKANVDVVAIDELYEPRTVYFCECKYWDANVSKDVVHAFQTVVASAGANWGLLIAKTGFQSGAVEAAEKSNIKLLTWDEFVMLFENRWVELHFRPTIRDKLTFLWDCYENRWDSHMPKLRHFHDKVAQLKEITSNISDYLWSGWLLTHPEHSDSHDLKTPLNTIKFGLSYKPQEIAEEQYLRNILNTCVRKYDVARAAIDDLHNSLPRENPWPNSGRRWP